MNEIIKMIDQEQLEEDGQRIKQFMESRLDGLRNQFLEKHKVKDDELYIVYKVFEFLKDKR